MTHPPHIETLAVHAGQQPDPTTGPMTPIHQTATTFKTASANTKATNTRAPATRRAPRSKRAWPS
jgi:O-acetylhomoserine/O-acetylserine sulfhydrylase-like pyridoxal-dependent enzyme